MLKSPSNRAKPAPLIATGINQVWTWDITYLASTLRGTFFLLIFSSRYIQPQNNWSKSL